MRSLLESIIFRADIIDGQLWPKNPEKLEALLRETIGPVEVSVSRIKKTRSTGKNGGPNINGLYWLYLQIIANETGHSEQELHEYFKKKLLPKRLAVVFGETIEMPNTTRKIDGMEMMDYMARIEEMTGVPTPDPSAV